MKRCKHVGWVLAVGLSVALTAQCTLRGSGLPVGRWLLSDTVACRCGSQEEVDVTVSHTLTFDSEGDFAHEGTARPAGEATVLLSGYGTYVAMETGDSLAIRHNYFVLDGIPTVIDELTVRFELPDVGLFSSGDILILTFPEDAECAPVEPLSYTRLAD